MATSCAVNTAQRRTADVEKEAQGGWRALHFASKSPAITQVLLSLDPKPSLESVTNQSRMTALICAAAEGTPEVVQQLLAAGANPNAADGLERVDGPAPHRPPRVGPRGKHQSSL